MMKKAMQMVLHLDIDGAGDKGVVGGSVDDD